MKKPTTNHEKVIIRPRPPRDAAQEGPVFGSPADTTAVPEMGPNEKPAEKPAEGQVEAEEE